MFKPNSVILYVEDVEKSTKFYTDVLQSSPIERFQEFSLFSLGDDVTLGLQSAQGIDPKPQPSFGGFELSLSDVSREEVDQVYSLWKEKGISIVLEPTDLDFGYTFVATDPDGHRLRVCATDTTNVS
ncbi:Glyoxalase-like domain protein [Pseudovibrio sp. Ad13]|uniref:VOC family protein n=1 Tax=unclassified Pseudovibrio TaxID=2627060 RepID=UPI0007AECEC0|nr:MULTISPECIES: VOC family protein [unclassified Pseudovibrio]KZK87030.1 Glyoxalase-like domain protein [Pseudovibrio sp. Ad13]KZK93763.1 Glyoxalase-like domain protein [Pseudovibrio sp. W74]KZL12086.1 Glyoxalase-like domain protein [Pseudovibrio sp. Ad14]